MKLQDLLTQLLAQIQDDTNLSDEVRDNAIELVSVVSQDPSPDNIRTLAIVLEKMGETTKYLSALETIKNIEAKSDQL